MESKEGRVNKASEGPDELSILAVFPGCEELEHEVHKLLEHLRDHGEWFEDDPEIREVIVELDKRFNPERYETGPLFLVPSEAGTGEPPRFSNESA